LSSLLTDPDRRILNVKDECSLRKDSHESRVESSDTSLAETKFFKPSNDITERICQRAHELYEQCGKVDGYALDDWLQAEAETLGAQKQRKVKAARASK